MLVFPNKKALLVKTRDPDQLLGLIPTAKPVEVNGQTLVAVPHKVDEVRVLTNLGFSPPSPIRYYYEWSGMYKPFNAQLDMAEFLSMRRRAYNLSEMGTGKSLSVLWSYDFLRAQGVLHSALVVCPLSTMERTWADEIFRNFPHLSYVVLHGDRKRRLKLLEQPADIYIVNHDGLKIISPELEKRKDIDLIVPDEIAQAARNAQTDRWKALNLVVNKQLGGTRWCWGLTGTPTPNLPTDAWAQCKLVTPSTVPQYFNRFKDQVMRQVNNFLWLPRPNATEVVHDVMQPAIRFSRAECVDLPECVFQTRQVELTAEQTKAYKQMLDKLRFEVEEGQVLAVNEAVKTSKLVQVASGVVYNEKREEVQLDATPRLSLVQEIVEEAQGKVLVFVPFISSVRYVADYLRSKGHTVECIYGEVSKAERDRIFGEFQNGSSLRIIVAQPAAMSHGLTLTAANTVIWYAPIFSNDTYDQACARITRPGQKLAQLIVNIEGSPVEKRMYERLRNKQKMQGLLLTMVEDGRIQTTA